MRITDALSRCYLDYLGEVFPEAGDRTDLVAYFFRRSFCLLRNQGSLGLLATKTIAQGDTRKGGLTWICNNGGEVFSAIRRMKWPGLAAVVVSVVNLWRGLYTGPRTLDGKAVPRITSYLFHQGGNDEPASLAANKEQAFVGCNILGMGFTFDDTNPDATPIIRMQELLKADSKNCEIIHPFIGGQEINSSPTQAPDRWVIDFKDFSEAEAKRWPELYQIVREKVWPERKDKAGAYSARWWQFGRRNKRGTELIENEEKVLVIAQTSNALAFAYLPSSYVFAHTVVIFPSTKDPGFCVLQSRVHQEWAMFFSAKMKDDARYIPTDCFETFPFPENFQTDVKLEAVGKEYYEFRAILMVKNDEGLTKTYNRFHNPNETSAEIKKLRQLHAAMDRAVLDAYGWKDLKPTCEFLLDYEEEEDEEEEASGRRQKKKPWRYRWPDEFRDTVLARLARIK